MVGGALRKLIQTLKSAARYSKVETPLKLSITRLSTITLCFIPNKKTFTATLLNSATTGSLPLNPFSISSWVPIAARSGAAPCCFPSKGALGAPHPHIFKDVPYFQGPIGTEIWIALWGGGAIGALPTGVITYLREMLWRLEGFRNAIRRHEVTLIRELWAFFPVYWSHRRQSIRLGKCEHFQKEFYPLMVFKSNISWFQNSSELHILVT